jgi:hypothetical protein
MSLHIRLEFWRTKELGRSISRVILFLKLYFVDRCSQEFRLNIAANGEEPRLWEPHVQATKIKEGAGEFRAFFCPPRVQLAEPGLLAHEG